MEFAAQDFRASGGELYSDEVNRISLYHRFQNIIHWEEVYSYCHNARENGVREDMSHQDTPRRRDIFYPSVRLFLARSDALDLAVKAGDNGDNHNHNDTGSFTLYKNGHPLFVDIGVESYTEKTFSSRRYEIWTMQSGYHNLPTLMGKDQKDGETYCATEVYTHFGHNASISMELLTAYPIPRPEDAGAAPFTYRRSVTLDKKEGKVVVKDTTNLPDVILNFITYEKPVVSEGRLQIGSLASAAFTGAAPLTRPKDFPGTQPPDSSPAVEVLPVTDERLKKAWDHDLYRVRLRMTGSIFTMEIK